MVSILASAAAIADIANCPLGHAGCVDYALISPTFIAQLKHKVNLFIRPLCIGMIFANAVTFFVYGNKPCILGSSSGSHRWHMHSLGMGILQGILTAWLV